MYELRYEDSVAMKLEIKQGIVAAAWVQQSLKQIIAVELSYEDAWEFERIWRSAGDQVEKTMRDNARLYDKCSEFTLLPDLYTFAGNAIFEENDVIVDADVVQRMFPDLQNASEEFLYYLRYKNGAGLMFAQLLFEEALNLEIPGPSERLKVAARSILGNYFKEGSCNLTAPGNEALIEKLYKALDCAVDRLR